MKERTGRKMTLTERPMNDKVNLIKQHEKMMDVLDEALQNFKLQYQNIIENAPNRVAVEVAIREQQVILSAIADLVEMVATKELEIAGDESLEYLIFLAHREAKEDDEAFLKDAKRKYGGARK